MKQSLLTLWLTGILMLLCQSASAYDFESEGLYYNITSNTGLTVRVTYYSSSISSNNYISGDVTIPSTVTYSGKTYSVTSIGYKPFSGCTGLTSITIPNSVTSIGNYAFYDCKGLTSITIPNSVTSIGNYAFSYCTGLTSITIPNSVTSIGYGAFENCHGLTSITIGNSVTSIGYDAFFGCTGLTSITIPNSVTSIGGKYAFYDCTNLQYNEYDNALYLGNTENPYVALIKAKSTDISSCEINANCHCVYGGAFGGCTGLTSITIGNSVTSIGREAFYDCTGLTSITIGNSVTSIGSDAFYNCSNLKKVYNNSSLSISKGSTDYGYVARYADAVYNNCTTDGEYVIQTKDDKRYICDYLGTATTLTLPNVDGIAEYAFYNRNDIKSITIPNSVTSIGSRAFYGCTGLTSITIPNSVTSIGGSAFYGCTGLTSITIPNSVTSIGNSAFSGCTNLQYNEYDNALYLGNTENPYVALIKAKSKTISSCEINANCHCISESAFNGCTGLTSITIPNSVTRIGQSAFNGCSSLESMSLPFTGNKPHTSSDTYQYPFGYIFGTSSYTGGTATKQYYYGSSTSSTIYSTYYIPSSLKSVTITGSSYIPYGAFYYCTGLTSIDIPNSVTSIGNSAFYDCAGLTSISIPNSVTSIGQYAFSGCTGLTSITIPNSVTSIGNGAFSGCTGLTSIIIGNSVTSIGQYAFSGCTGLTSITIPNSVTSIGGSAFSGCSSLESMSLPFTGDKPHTSSDTYQYPFGFIFGTSSYTGGTATTQYYYDSSTSSTTSSTYYIPSSLKSVTITGCSYIPYGAFRNCTRLTSITMPNSVTSIGSYAFYGCKKLTSITMPNSVTSIGYRAFYDCTGLTNITIPNCVTNIGSSAFYNCSNLKKVYNNSSLSISKGSTDYGYVALYAVAVYNNCSTDGDYVLQTKDDKRYICDYLGTATTLTLPNVDGIAEYAFYNRNDIKSITIPNSVTSIGDGAFEGCTNLQYNEYDNALYLGNIDNPYVALIKAKSSDISSCEINANCHCISESAFYGCSGLTSITIPNSVTSIGESAFKGCTGLTSITIPNSMTSIEVGAFENCSNLKKVYNNSSLSITKGSSGNGHVAYYAVAVYNNCTTDGEYVIQTKDDKRYICDYLGTATTLILPNVDGIAEYAFYNRNDIKSITIPNSVTSIGSHAFYGSKGLTNIVIPNSVTSIGSSAFYNCTGLTSIDIPNSVTSIDDYAFRNCTGLTSITIPNSVTSIGNYTFSGCTGLTSITIPNSVTSIGGYAFRNCTGLTSITIPNSVTSIGNSAFSGCTNLQYNEYDNALYLGNTDNPYVVLINSKSADISSCEINANCHCIYQSAFYGCTGLTSITIPNSVTSIGDKAFYNCRNLNKVYNFSSLSITKGSYSNGYVAYYAIAVYNNCTTEGDYVIQTKDDQQYVCDYLGTATTLSLPNVEGIAEYAFYNRNVIKSITIPNSVTSIKDYAFYGCADLTNVTLGNNVTSIGDYAFYNCTGLTNITIPNSVTSIGESAFNGCTGLTSITLGNSVTSIGGSAFNGCKIRDLQVLAETPATISSNTFSGQSQYQTTLFVPYGCSDNYAYDDTYWYMFIHIKESAAATQNLSPRQAYALKNAATRSYIVYDAVNDAVAEISLDANIDDDNANHNWQVIEQDGKTYIYNIGAKKYLYATSTAEAASMRTVASATAATSTQWKLSETPVAMSLSTGESGINIGNGGEWLFVLNPTLAVDENVSAIEQLDAIMELNSVNTYSLEGTQVLSPRRNGLYVRAGQSVLVK